MRIGFDAKRLYNNFTGLGNHSRTTIDILTSAYPSHEYWLYTPKVKLNELTLPYLTKKGCYTVKPTGLMRGSAWRTYGLVEKMKQDGIEVFHGLSNEMPVGLFHSGIASVVTIHDVAFKTFPDMYHWHDRKIYNMKWQYACNHADRIVCISECTKNDVLEFYNVPERKVEVVYQPVNPIYYESAEREAGISPYMLYVGSINPRKNLLGVVKAWELMHQDIRVPLVVVGCGGSYKRKVQQYLVEQGLERWVEWKELVSNEELKRLYTNAQMLVCPSFYSGGYEPMVEALLCGCPVVTSHANRLPGKGNAYVMQADPNSTEDMRDNMTKLMTDSALRQQIVEQGRAYMMDTFAPQKLAQQLMAVYEAVKR